MKRKSIVVSALALMISIGLMVFGVYSAGVTVLNVTGQVSYSVHDVKVLIQGKVNGAKESVEVDYPDADSDLYTNSQKVGNQSGVASSQYLGYTTGESFGDEDDNLSEWYLGDLEFTESSDGITPIVVSFKITNYSPYPVMARISFNKAYSEMIEANITYSGSTSAYISANVDNLPPAYQEITITFKPKSDAANVNAADIGMTLTVEKTAPKNSAANIDSLSMVGFSNNVSFQAFSYSTDNGLTWEGVTQIGSYNSLPSNTTNIRYIMGLGSCISVGSTYDSGGDSDYYNSEIRKYIKENVVDELNISTNDWVYRSIYGRTITDLYEGRDLPEGADGNETDLFWIPSKAELELGYMAEPTTKTSSKGTEYTVYENRLWIDPSAEVLVNMYKNYWTRTPSSSKQVYYVSSFQTVDNSMFNYYGGISTCTTYFSGNVTMVNLLKTYAGYVRIAFEMKIV